jgi:phosphoglycolate phosphatase
MSADNATMPTPGPAVNAQSEAREATESREAAEATAEVAQAKVVDRKQIRGAIIDLDGTMVDTAGDFNAALNLMLDALHLPEITSEELLRYVGKGSEHLVRQVLAARLPEQEATRRFEAALDHYQHAYAQVNGQHSALYDDVAEGLAALRDAGLRLACVTNKPHRFAVDLLAQMGLSEYFEVIFGGDSFARKKPDPLPLIKASEALGLSTAQMLAIGDSENDALAARAAGIAVLTVPYGYNHGQPVHSIDSDGIVGSLLEAARWLNQ